MRRFYCEDSIDYSRYHFRYRPMAELESVAELPELYGAGFLPASSDLSEDRHLFYLARSLRYNLSTYSLDKKRRYDFRKVERMVPEFEVAPKAKAEGKLSRQWEVDAFRWMQESRGAYLSSERLAYVWGKPHCSHVAIASYSGQPFAYALLGWHGRAAHYWYAFYDSRRFPQLSLGKWLMARTAHWARERDLRHLYVGTGYGCDSTYKTQGIAGVEFFDGSQWRADDEELRRRQLTDPPKLQ